MTLDSMCSKRSSGTVAFDTDNQYTGQAMPYQSAFILASAPWRDSCSGNQSPCFFLLDGLAHPLQFSEDSAVSLKTADES